MSSWYTYFFGYSEPATDESNPQETSTTIPQAPTFPSPDHTLCPARNAPTDKIKDILDQKADNVILISVDELNNALAKLKPTVQNKEPYATPIPPIYKELSDVFEMGAKEYFLQIKARRNKDTIVVESVIVNNIVDLPEESSEEKLPEKSSEDLIGITNSNPLEEDLIGITNSNPLEEDLIGITNSNPLEEDLTQTIHLPTVNLELPSEFTQ
jgi:hypothetical protein